MRRLQISAASLIDCYVPEFFLLQKVLEAPDHSGGCRRRMKAACRLLPDICPGTPIACRQYLPTHQQRSDRPDGRY